MKATARRLRIPGILQTRASLEPSTFDEKARTVELTFTTGARGLRRSWFDGPYYEELEVSERAIDLSRMNNGASVMNNHGTWGGGVGDVIGVVERAWIEGKEGRALVRLSDREDVKPIVADVKSGVLRHVSVGYTVQKYEQVEKVDEVPVYRATRWTPMELSLVPIAFDDGAVVRGRNGPEMHEVELITRSEEQIMEEKKTETPAETTAQPTATILAMPVQAPATTEASSRAAAQAATQAERERVAAIQQLVTRHKLGDEFGAKLVSTGTSLADARALILDELVKRSDAAPPNPNAQHMRLEPGEDERDKLVRTATAALFEKAGVVAMIREAQRMPVASEGLRDVVLDPGGFRRWSMVDMAREMLERRGKNTRGWDRMRVIGEALVSRSGMQTTSDFAILLESAMGKILLAAYATTPDTWRRFCGVKSVPDFRTANLYRAGSFGVLDSLNEHGEFKRKAIPDGEKATISADTKGNIIGITRKALVNDDLGAFNDLGVSLGRAAKLTIENAVYALIKLNSGLGPTQTDGQPFFHATRGNVGTSGALSVATLDGSRAVMAAQRDPSGNQILDLRPAIWLGPVGLGGEARVLNENAYEPADNKFQKANKVRGLFRDVVDTANLTGTRHYLFADPAIAPSFAVAFIDGQEAPVLEQKDGWDMDGTEFKVREDFGVAAIDYRAAITCPGA